MACIRRSCGGTAFVPWRLRRSISGGIQEPSALPAVETPAPTQPPAPTSTPTPPSTPTPTPTLTPMERKYSDFDPSGAELKFEILDELGIPQDKENAERVLAE